MVNTRDMTKAGIPAKMQPAGQKVVQATRKRLRTQKALRRAEAAYNASRRAEDYAGVALTTVMEAEGLDNESQEAIEEKLAKAARREERQAEARAREARKKATGWSTESSQDA